MATLADVARVAGVTAATVSNVLTGRVAVREETRQKVLAAITQVGYRPNLVARGLAGGKTFTLALLVPSLVNPFFAEVVEEMEAAAAAHDYQLLLALSHGQASTGTRHLERLASRWVDGFIVMGEATTTRDVVALAASGQHVVLSVWGEDPAALTLPSVDIDFARAGEIATQHLIARGHRRIAAIVELPVQQTRLMGYQRALQAAAITVPQAFVQRGDSSFVSGQQAMRTLLAQTPPPTAVFAGNDAMAMGALDVLHDAGVNVPTTLAVVGVDDVLLAEHTSPPLTTIRIPKRELARMAVEMVLASIAAGASSPQRHLLAPTLIVRQST